MPAQKRFLQRNLAPRVLDALARRPVVLVAGARQTGKTILVEALAADGHAAAYHTFDDSRTLALAASDPQGWIEALQGPVIIDEVQRLPEILRAIKLSVDRDRQPGRFLLTGSANILMAPRAAESLAGRMEVHTLWPLSHGEIEGRRDGFIDAALAGRPATMDNVDGSHGAALEAMVLRGGYPEPALLDSEEARADWVDAYVDAIVTRDIRDMADVSGLRQMPQLLRALAARCPGPLNLSDLSRVLGIPWTTLQRYTDLLLATYVVQFIPAFSGSASKCLTRAPKVVISDSGLLARLLDIDAERMRRDRELFGHLLEDFVIMELMKQSGWSSTRVKLSHFRTQRGAEVDAVLEGGGGRVVGVEVKAASDLGPHDFKGLRELADTVGDRFVRGIVLYTGRDVVRVSAPPVELFAMPVSALWTWGAVSQPVIDPSA